MQGRNLNAVSLITILQKKPQSWTLALQNIFLLTLMKSL